MYSFFRGTNLCVVSRSVTHCLTFKIGLKSFFLRFVAASTFLRMKKEFERCDDCDCALENHQNLRPKETSITLSKKRRPKEVLCSFAPKCIVKRCKLMIKMRLLPYYGEYTERNRLLCLLG